LTTHQEKSVSLSEAIPVTRDLLSQMNWFMVVNESEDLSVEDIIAHANLLSVGKGVSGEGMFIIDVSDATRSILGKKICLTESERDAYLNDREEYVAGHFGLSVPEYHEWIRLDGLCMCGGDTVTGKPCKNGVSDKHLSASEWKARHRVALCGIHLFMSRGRERAYQGRLEGKNLFLQRT
jgi:hypothetical protein